MDETSSSLLHLPVVGNLWFFEIIIGIVVLVGINYLFKKAVKHVRHRSLSTKPDWREKIDQILYLPFEILLWVLGGTLVVEILGRRFGISFFDNYLDAFRSTLFVFCCAWALLRWKAVMQKEFLNKEGRARHIDTGFMHVIGKILSVVVVLIASMVVLQVWGLNIAPLIAFGGIGAAAVGFAGKDVIANFFGGLMLYINRPFMVGDTIHLPDRHLEGTVEEIGWYLTTLRDKEKRPVYLPNALFSELFVINGSRMTHRHIEEKIGVRYEDFSKVPTLVESIKQTIASHPEIDRELPIQVVIDAFSPMTIDIHFDAYTLETRQEKYLTIRHEVLMQVYQEVLKAGAEVPIAMVPPLTFSRS